MQKKHFEKMGIDVSRLGYGCMRFPTKADGTIDREKSLQLIDYAYQHGVNYFDTAYRYHGGESERFVKEALSRYPRESYNLATKFPIGFMPEETEEAVYKIFEEQLEKTGAGYFDFYLVHGLNATKIQLMKDLKLLDKLEEFKAKGLIRHIGFSFHDTPEVLREILDLYDGWEFCQIQLNYLDWDYQDAKGQYGLLTERGIPVIVMEPVRGGALSDLCEEANALLKQHRPEDSIASWAMRFCGSLPNVHVILSGMTTMEQVVDNVRTFEQFEPYSDEEYNIIAEALELRRKIRTVPCTACRYCTEYCPQGIDIPGMFSIYNSYMFTGSSFAFDKDIQAVTSALPEACIACGACAEHCPQKIDIPGRMTEMDAAIKAL
ncbi:MAG: Fe-S oxidoreductase [Clostridiales bacterium]|nr:MAG: Fe-S oxidoreductase [Clostridiales bacterium]